MTQNDLTRIKDFYEKVIKQLIIKPVEINDIYQLIHPDSSPKDLAYFTKQRCISVFVQNKQWETLNMLEDLFELEEVNEEDIPENTNVIDCYDFDKVDTALPTSSNTLSVDNTNQSHSERDREYVSHGTIKEDNHELINLQSELDNLMDNGEISDENKTKIRSLKMRITLLKKKLNNE